MANLMKDIYNFKNLRKKYGNFMVPVAAIEIMGTDIISSGKMQVTNIDISLGIDGASTLSFTVNNIFDLKSRTINSKAKNYFKLGNTVEAKLGYGSVTKSVFYGYITEINTEFTESPTISVTVVDVVSLLMKSKREKHAYKTKNYSDVINQMLSTYPKCYKGLKVDKTNDQLTVEIQDGSDYDYINDVICLKTNKQFMVLAGNIYLRDYDDVSKPIMELEWGVGFLSFTETKKLVNTKYIVLAWDDKNKKSITASETASSDSLAASFKSKPSIEVVSSASVHDAEHAKAIAKALAERKELEGKSGRGRTIGLPEIVPGRYIKISNIGSTDTYYIKSVRHSFSSGGFLTDFELGN